MRSSLLFGALCAAGVLAKPLHKRAYVTDWTIVTITETITSWPQPTATSTFAVNQDLQVVDHNPVTTVETFTTAVPVVTSVSTAPTTTVAPVPVSSASSSSTTLSTSTSTAAAAASTTDAYQSAILYNHNIHRSNHSASSLSWSSSLESSAYALASACVYQHDTSIDGGGYGQNIGYGVSADSIGVMITNLMYNDEMEYYASFYGEANPDMSNFDSWGHFSQIVWQATTEVGCATVVCPTLGNVDASEALPFTVCNYSPAGNYDGEYGANVLAPLGKPFYTA